jgi:hypothetical protein
MTHTDRSGARRGATLPPWMVCTSMSGVKGHESSSSMAPCRTVKAPGRASATCQPAGRSSCRLAGGSRPTRPRRSPTTRPTPMMSENCWVMVHILAAERRPEAVRSLCLFEPATEALARGDPDVEAVIERSEQLLRNPGDDPRAFLAVFLEALMGVGATSLPDPLPADMEPHARLAMRERPPWDWPVPTTAASAASWPKIVVSGGQARDPARRSAMRPRSQSGPSEWSSKVRGTSSLAPPAATIFSNGSGRRTTNRSPLRTRETGRPERARLEALPPAYPDGAERPHTRQRTPFSHRITG